MRIILSGALVFLIWTGLSSWFYVCQVKGLCSAALEEEGYPVQEMTGDAESVAADSSAMVIAETPSTLVTLFDTDKWNLIPDSEFKNQCMLFKTWANSNPGSLIYITGHTDATGSAAYNLALGERRAEVVRDYLFNMGIPATQMVVESKGENSPAANNNSRDGRRKNRRTEISINH